MILVLGQGPSFLYFFGFAEIYADSEKEDPKSRIRESSCRSNQGQRSVVEAIETFKLSPGKLYHWDVKLCAILFSTRKCCFV